MTGQTPNQFASQAHISFRARTAKVVRLSDWLSEAQAALQSPDKDADTPRRTFNRARATLQSKEICGIWEDWAWLNF